jgi:hypothetical protein
MPRPTVHRNKQGEGSGVRVPAATSGSAGSTPAALLDLTYEELYHIAQERNVSGRSSMTKDELIAALEG